MDKTSHFGELLKDLLRDLLSKTKIKFKQEKSSEIIATLFLYNEIMKLKNNIHVIFFDIDFTAFDHTHFKVRPLTIYAMKQLKEKGYKLCISTSRGFDEIREIDKEFVELCDAIVCLAGAYILVDGQVITKPIDKNLVNKIIRLLDNNNIPYRYATIDGKGYLSESSEFIYDLFYKYYHMVPSEKKYEGEDVLQIMYYGADKDFHDKLRMISNKIDVINMKYNNEISSKSSNKGDIIEEVCLRLHEDPKSVMSFGDSENDLSLLTKSCFGVAMGNACDELKKVADYICENEDNDGIYKTFVKYGFIEEYKQINKEVFNDIKNTITNYYINYKDDIAKVSEMFVDTIQNNGIIQLFGINKHEQFCQEFFYRSGGLVYFHKITNPSINTLEKINKIEKNDLFVLVCNEGNEKEIVDLAKYAKRNNHKVIVFVEEKGSADPNLFDLIIVFDNHNKSYEYTLNNTLAQLINASTYSLLKNRNIKPLIFLSNNIENSKSYNEEILKKYEGRII